MGIKEGDKFTIHNASIKTIWDALAPAALEYLQYIMLLLKRIDIEEKFAELENLQYIMLLLKLHYPEIKIPVECIYNT